MSFEALLPTAVETAYNRIKNYTNKTPILSSGLLNEWLGAEILFKVEGFQKIGAFKFRGALNTILTLKEQGNLPTEIVSFSSGNHAQAVALAGKMFGIKTTVLMTKTSSAIKKQATRSYGAEVIETNTRAEAEAMAAEMEKNGAYFIHPFDNDMVIAGQGTSCFEALTELNAQNKKVDAIFATCGGGGWLSGSFLAKQLLAPDAKIFAGEPLNGNDATRSYNSGQIFKFSETPKTLADGAATLGVSERTFSYLKQLDGFFEASEEEMIYWTQWLSHTLKSTIEPTSAVAMVAAHKWLQAELHVEKDGVGKASEQKVIGQKASHEKPRILILLSGGNISPETYSAVWKENKLDNFPRI